MTKKPSIRGLILFMVTLINVIIIKYGFTTSAEWYCLLVVSLPLLIVAGGNMTRPR